MLKETFIRTQDFNRAFNKILEIHKESPERAERIHTVFMAQNIPPVENIPLLPTSTKVGLLNYLVRYVHDNAHHRANFLTASGMLGQQRYINEEAYPYELALARYLKSILEPPVQLRHMLLDIADALTDILNDGQLGEMLANFPSWHITKKCVFSDGIGGTFAELAQDRLQIPINTAETFHEDDESTPNAAAKFCIYRDKNGERYSIIFVSSWSLKQPLQRFVSDMAHEHTHSLLDQMAIAYESSPESFEDHPYEESFFYAWAISHTKQFNLHLRSLYAMDMEEELCNMVAERFSQQLSRFSPSHQIEQQPLLDL